MFSKVKIQPVAKYDWEHKYYYGRLIAVSNSFLAYAIRGEFSSTCVDSCVQKNLKCFCDYRSTFNMPFFSGFLQFLGSYVNPLSELLFSQRAEISDLLCFDDQ